MHSIPNELSLGKSHPEKFSGKKAPISQNKLEEPYLDLVIEETDIDESMIREFQNNRKTKPSEFSGLEVNPPERKSSESPDAEIWPHNAFIEHFNSPNRDGIDLDMSPKTSQNNSNVGLNQQEIDDLENEFHFSIRSDEAMDSELGTDYFTARFGEQGDTMTTEELNKIQKII